MVNDVELEVPLSSSEAHLDLPLGEELAVNPEFLQRFIQPLWGILEEAPPAGGNLTAVVRLNMWDDGGPGCVAIDGGENDIDVLVTRGGHTLRVLIEDRSGRCFNPIRLVAISAEPTLVGTAQSWLRHDRGWLAPTTPAIFRLSTGSRTWPTGWSNSRSPLKDSGQSAFDGGLSFSDSSAFQPGTCPSRITRPRSRSPVSACSG